MLDTFPANRHDMDSGAMPSGAEREPTNPLHFKE
ncbi:MAG: hypothetical protein [Siphoviridae sp. ctdEk19]|nr:MAG: hypothetical protein [Siphoviridae sp. ctdEk19]